MRLGRSGSNRPAYRRKPLLALLLAAIALLGSTVVPVVALRFFDPPTTAFIVQRQRQARQAGRTDFAIHRRWVPLAQLPAYVPLAVLSSEDQRFFAHRGFDVDAMKHAIGAHLQGAELRGASTITQQVAKNLFLWEGRSFVRKALEGYFTVLLELAWPKRRILEVYLNIAELGDGVFGVGAAARHHFGRDARQLTAAQAALLAAILPDPRGRSARHPSQLVRNKQRWILAQMRVLGARAEWRPGPLARCLHPRGTGPCSPACMTPQTLRARSRTWRGCSSSRARMRSRSARTSAGRRSSGISASSWAR